MLNASYEKNLDGKHLHSLLNGVSTYLSIHIGNETSNASHKIGSERHNLWILNRPIGVYCADD